MRKASHDGIDSTSITSGVENETKKSAMKLKKSSLKRKVPSFSQESDDTVIEPLLQKDKEKPEFQSAKNNGKAKTVSVQNKESDNKAKTTVTAEFCGTTESLLSFKDSETTKTTAGAAPPLHNYMNTNVFNSHDNAKVNVTTKSQILVEIDSTKQSSYTPSPLIFTTAKIHTDAKPNHMEPVQMTPVPILSTIEVNMSKGGNVTMHEKKISNGSSVINSVYSQMPINKDKDERVSCFTTVSSPNLSKDSFVIGVTVTSSVKLANVTTAHNNSIKISLPSTTSNFLIMKSDTNNKQGDIKDVKKEQTLPQFTRSLDSAKINFTVKTTIPSLKKAIDNSTISGNSDKAQAQKTDGFEKLSADTGSNSSQFFTSNDKTLNSTNSDGISNITRNVTTTIGNKQLQRQKTTTEDITDSGPKSGTGREHFENISAKDTSTTHPNIIDSISKIDIPSDISANNLQSTIPKITANSISKIMPISTTTKSNVTAISTSKTVTTPVDGPSKPSITSTISNKGQTVSPNTHSSKPTSNVNEVTIASTICYNNDSNKDNNIQSTSIVSSKCSDVTKTQTKPQKAIFSKTVPEKVPVSNVSIANTTGTVSAANSKTVKQFPVVVPTDSTISTQSLSKSTTKSADSKVPSVTTSAKTNAVNPNINISTKPSSYIATETSSSKLPISSSLVDAATTLIPKTLPSANICITTSQSIMSTQGNVNKPATPVVYTYATSKTDSVTQSGKQATANSSVPASTTADAKSPNNNSTLVFGPSKPSTTIPKTEPVKALPKTSAGTLSTNVTVATCKSPQGTSATKTNTKDSVALAKKPAVTKTSVATKSSVSSVNKPVVGTAAKTATTVTSSALSSAAKKPAAIVSAKTSSVTTSVKAPLVSPSTKTPDETSSNSTTRTTTTSRGISSAAIKPTSSAAQVSSNKSIGTAGSSVPSFTPALRPSESVKKGGAKSSENNKDGRVSKA